MTNKPYKPNTTLYEIIRDGWSRDFAREQTCMEAEAMGFVIDLSSIGDIWALMTNEMILIMEKEPAHEATNP